MSRRRSSTSRFLRPLAGLLALALVAWGAYWGGKWLHGIRTAPAQPGMGSRVDVHVLDVGDGTSVLIKTPDNHTLLIDAGSRAHPATEVATLLGGRRSVDLILLTGTRSRSIGGFRALMNAIRVNGPVLLAGDADDYRRGGRAARDVLAVLHERGITGMPYDEYLLSHPNPIPGESGIQIAGLPVESTSTSDLSMAVRVEYKASAVLYAAGLTAAGANNLLSHDGKLACDILCIPSSGSKRTASPELLALAGPQVIAVSCDREHTLDDQAQRWMFASGAKVGRTDLLGSFVLHMYGGANQPVTWTYSGTPGTVKASGAAR